MRNRNISALFLLLLHYFRMTAGDQGLGNDLNEPAQELFADLKRLRRYGLRRLPRRVQLPRLEEISLALDPGSSTPLEARLKSALQAGARHLPEKYGEAMADLLDFADTPGKKEVGDRRKAAAARVGAKTNYFYNSLEKRTLKELADQLVRLAAERIEQDQCSGSTLEPVQSDETKLPAGKAPLTTDPVQDRLPLDAIHSLPTSGRLVLAVLAAILVAALAWTQWLHISRAPVPRTTLASLSAETERELTGDQTPVQGDVSRLLGYGDPTREGRTTYPYVAHKSEASGGGTPASPTPTLNVLTDVPYHTGDERKFVYVAFGTAKRPLANKVTRRSLLAKDGELVWLRIYIDNGASPEPNCSQLTGLTIARHTTVRVAIWDSPDKHLHIFRAWIYAENAGPRWVTDAVAVLTASPRTLELIPSLSSQYSDVPPTYRSHPPLASRAIIEPAGMPLGGNGLLGSCWQNRFSLLLVFRQQ